MQIATPIRFMGLGQDIDAPTQSQMVFIITPRGIEGADIPTRTVIRGTLDNINEAFGVVQVATDPPVINPTMVLALKDLARSAAQSSEVTDREAAAQFATLINDPESVRANIVAILDATTVLAARFEPLPPPAFPSLQVRRESGIALAGLLFVGLLAAGVGAYFWIVRPSRG